MPKLELLEIFEEKVFEEEYTTKRGTKRKRRRTVYCSEIIDVLAYRNTKRVEKILNNPDNYSLNDL